MNDIEKAIKQLKNDIATAAFLYDEASTAVIKEHLVKCYTTAISALEKQIELNDYLNTLRKNKKYQIYDILSEFALEGNK